MFRRWMLVLLGCTVLMIGLSSCDDDQDTTGPGTQPLISQITATATIVDAGGQVTLTVSASGTDLTWLWTASGGTFDSPTTASTLWTAPAAPGVYLVSVTAAATNNLTATSSRAIGVEIGLQVSAATASVRIANQTRIAALAVGDDLTYQWTTTAGTLTQVTPDTVLWRAPEAVPTQNPRVQVVVTDGSGNARTEAVELQVTAYLPTDAPVYRGDAYCGLCHVGTHANWSTTAHKTAYETLAAIGMGQNAYCLGCHTVGSVGLDADPALDNGGYDEIPIAALRGVQCENCHGPGGNHPGTQPTLPVSFAAETCGDCHNGAHHPFYDEWAGSGHGNSDLLDGGSPARNRSCAKCHNGLNAATYLDNPPGFVNPATNPTVAGKINCQTCHSSHGTENRADLRNAAATDVVLPDGSVIPQAGAGRLCMACHNGRRTLTNITDQLNNGTAHLGPHHSCQGDMLAGTGANEAINPGFPWGSSTHLQIQDGCVSCHTHAKANDVDAGVPNYTGHDFQPTVEACQTCHGAISAFSDVAAIADYDDDGEVEGIQFEVAGLIETLHETILDRSDSPEQRQALVDDYEASIGDITISNIAQRNAAYNLAFVEFDASHGVHNAKYAIQLLQQSILYLAPPEKVTRHWKLLLD